MASWAIAGMQWLPLRETRESTPLDKSESRSWNTSCFETEQFEKRWKKAVLPKTQKQKNRSLSGESSFCSLRWIISRPCSFVVPWVLRKTTARVRALCITSNYYRDYAQPHLRTNPNWDSAERTAWGSPQKGRYQCFQQADYQQHPRKPSRKRADVRYVWEMAGRMYCKAEK